MADEAEDVAVVASEAPAPGLVTKQLWQGGRAPAWAIPKVDITMTPTSIARAGACTCPILLLEAMLAGAADGACREMGTCVFERRRRLGAESCLLATLRFRTQKSSPVF